MFCDIFFRQINFNWILIILLSLLSCKCVPILLKSNYRQSQSYRSQFFIHNISSLSNPRIIFPRSQTNSSLLSSLNRSSRSNPIVFPTSESIKTRYLRVPQLNENGDPNCLQTDRDTYCESVQDYPLQYIRDQLVTRLDEYRDLFGLKGIDSRKSYSDEDSSEERVCRSTKKIIFPRMAKTESKRWVYVVNDERELRQHVIVEVCEKPDKECNYIEDGIPPGYYSKCKQKYAFRRLLAVHPTDNKTYTDTFRFPSCCVCVVKSSYSLDFLKN